MPGVTTVPFLLRSIAFLVRLSHTITMTFGFGVFSKSIIFIVWPSSFKIESVSLVAA